MYTYFLIALGGAVGSVARYGLGTAVDGRLGAPWGTWLVNVLGCFCIGLIANGERQWIKPFVMVGVLGGFTTFSAFSLQSVVMLQQGEVMRAIVYVMASISVCLIAVWLGMLAGRSFA